MAFLHEERSGRSRCLRLAVLLIGLTLGACGDSGDTDVPVTGAPGSKRSVPAPLDMTSFDATLAASIREQVKAVEAALEEVEAWRSLGALYEAHQMNGLALDCYERASELAPAEGRISYRIAVLRGRDGDVEAALEALRTTFEQAPDYGPAYLRAGAWTLELGRLEEAEGHYRQARERGGQEAAAVLGLAQVALARGQWPQALEQLGDPQSYPEAARALAYQLAGTALARLGREQEASDALARGRGAKPYLPDPWTRSVTSQKTGGAALYLKGARMLERGRLEQATQLLERAREATGDEDLGVLRSLAEAYSRTQRFEEAEAVLDVLTRKPDADVATWIGLGRVRFARQDRAGAQAAWQAALELDPANPEAHALNVTSRVDQPDELLAAAQAAREQGVVHAEIELAEGKLHVEGEAFDQARACFTRCTELAPEWAEAWVGLALAEQGLEQLDAARVARDRAAALDPQHPLLPALSGVLDGTSEETPR